MKKMYIITFSLSALLLFTISVIGLMLMLPQQVKVFEGNINDYKGIKKADFTFESTKDVSDENLTKLYTISSDDMSKFKNKNQYKNGNSDPFATKNENTGNNGTDSNVNKPNENTTGDGNSTNENITNSNDGQPNPPSTNK